MAKEDINLQYCFFFRSLDTDQQAEQSIIIAHPFCSIVYTLGMELMGRAVVSTVLKHASFTRLRISYDPEGPPSKIRNQDSKLKNHHLKEIAIQLRVQAKWHCFSNVVVSPSRTYL